MLFNSIDFAIFLPIVFLLFWVLFYKNKTAQNVFFLIVSYVFYGWWDWRFLSLIFFSSLLDFILGQQLHIQENKNRRRLLLIISLIINLGLLGFFKYYNFFVESFINAFSLFGASFQAERLNILLPVGISFYTFQTLSYTIDVYKKKMEPTNDVFAFFAFVSFFPQLVAGPIERASNLLPQFYKKRVFNSKLAHEGLLDIAWGLFKKIVIADGLSFYINLVYGDIYSFSGFPIVWATLFFAFQIYCDFSGYSSIAIGTAKLFGFDLMQNFKRPYLSSSLPEFWSRWHISLSTWFKDYVYIPLGGSKVSKTRRNINLIITFLVSGFWHGANWTFIVWGLIHGVVNSVNKWRVLNKKKNVVSVFVVFSIVCVAWIFFRANNLSEAFYALGHLIPNSFSNIIGISTISKYSFVSALIYIAFLMTVEVFLERRFIKKQEHIYPSTRQTIWLSLGLFVLVYLFGTFENQEFIYFQF